MTAVMVLLGFLFLKTGEKFATQETAGPAVTEFMTTLAQPLSVKFAPWVGNDPAKAVEYVTAKKPSFGIVTPGFYLAYAKALEMKPDNGAYLDSMGWYYFKAGKFEEAKKELPEEGES